MSNCFWKGGKIQHLILVKNVQQFGMNASNTKTLLPCKLKDHYWQHKIREQLFNKQEWNTIIKLKVPKIIKNVLKKKIYKNKMCIKHKIILLIWLVVNFVFQ